MAGKGGQPVAREPVGLGRQRRFSEARGGRAGPAMIQLRGASLVLKRERINLAAMLHGIGARRMRGELGLQGAKDHGAGFLAGKRRSSLGRRAEHCAEADAEHDGSGAARKIRSDRPRHHPGMSTTQGRPFRFRNVCNRTIPILLALLYHRRVIRRVGKPGFLVNKTCPPHGLSACDHMIGHLNPT